MNNFELYRLLNFIVNKDIYAKAMSPSEFDLALKSANMRHFRKRLGLPETYIPGSANEGAGVTRVNDRDLLPFLVEESVTPVSGLVTLTSTWYYILDWYTDSSITADLIGYDEWSSRKNNYITKPTKEHPAAYIVSAGLKVSPSQTSALCSNGKVNVIYYRKPVTPSFVTTTDPVTLEMTYSNTSVELEWDDGNKIDILYIILQSLGMNVERQDVLQMANKLIQTGK